MDHPKKTKTSPMKWMAGIIEHQQPLDSIPDDEKWYILHTLNILHCQYFFFFHSMENIGSFVLLTLLQRSTIVLYVVFSAHESWETSFNCELHLSNW